MTLTFTDLGRVINFPPIQMGQNANHKVNVKLGSDNGAEKTSHTLNTLAEYWHRKGKLDISLGSHYLIIYRKRCLSKVIVIPF